MGDFQFQADGGLLGVVALAHQREGERGKELIEKREGAWSHTSDRWWKSRLQKQNLFDLDRTRRAPRESSSELASVSTVSYVFIS